MAHVKMELRNEGRGLHEWDYVSLSEHRVVAAQIKSRSHVDATYYMKMYGNIQGSFVTQGVTPFSEPITCVYLDLDGLIDTCGLAKGELEVVNSLMFGYTMSDLADNWNVTPQTQNTLFNRAVDKIVKKNNANWIETNTKRQLLS